MIVHTAKGISSLTADLPIALAVSRQGAPPASAAAGRSAAMDAIHESRRYRNYPQVLSLIETDLDTGVVKQIYNRAELQDIYDDREERERISDVVLDIQNLIMTGAIWLSLNGLFTAALTCLGFTQNKSALTVICCEEGDHARPPKISGRS